MSRVHLWCWPTDCPCETDWGLLDGAEQERGRRFVHERHRIAFARAHAGMRRILGRWLDASPAALAFDVGPYGKPHLASHRGPYFSLSHSDGLAALAVSSEFDLGLDIERCRPIEAEILAAQFFSRCEQQALSALPVHARQNAFFEAWTRKEAFLKAVGLGLAENLGSFTVSFGPDIEPALLALDGAPTETNLWQLVAFCPATGFRGAVAARANGWTVVREYYQILGPPNDS